MELFDLVQCHQLGSWKILSRYQKSELAFITIIMDALPVNGEPVYEEVLTWCHRAMGKFRAQFKTCLRHRLPELIWRGAYEFDLVRGSSYGKRAELFQSLSVTPADHVLVPHVHFVAATGRHGKARISEELRRAFRGPYRVYVGDLYRHQTVVEALTNIKSYVSKQRLQYSCGGIDGERTKYVDDYEDVWKVTVRGLYRDLPTLFQSR